jgi:hypothetical protein
MIKKLAKQRQNEKKKAKRQAKKAQTTQKFVQIIRFIIDYI